MVDDDEDDEKVIPKTASGGRSQKIERRSSNQDGILIKSGLVTVQTHRD